MVDIEERNTVTTKLDTCEEDNVGAEDGDSINHGNERKNAAVGNINLECHNDKEGLLHISTNIDIVELNKTGPTEAKSSEDDSKLVFHNHHTNEQHTPSKLGDSFIMAVTQFGAS